MNSPIVSQSHSPCVSKATHIGGKNMAGEMSNSKFLNPDPWTRLIGRANEGKGNTEWKGSDSLAGHWKPSDTY